MGSTAGFACASCVGQDLINSALRAVTAASPGFSFSLPNIVAVGNVSITISGVLVAIAPQVTLQANVGDLVSVDFGFAGQVLLSAGADKPRLSKPS